MIKVDQMIRQNTHLSDICKNNDLIQFMMAFAYSRSGDANYRCEALRILNDAHGHEKINDYFIMNLYGQIYKDMYFEDENTENREMALSWFKKSYNIKANTYAGINICMLLIISGHCIESQELRDLAIQLFELVGQQGDIRSDHNYRHLLISFEFYSMLFGFEFASDIAFYIYMLDPPVWCLQSTLKSINMYWRHLNSLKLSEKFVSMNNEKYKFLLDFWLEFFNDAISCKSTIYNNRKFEDCSHFDISIDHQNKKSFPAFLDLTSYFCNEEAKLCEILKPCKKKDRKFFELYISISDLDDEGSYIVLDCIRNNKNDVILPCNMILSIVRAQDPRALFIYFISDMDNYKFYFSCKERCANVFDLINNSRKVQVNPEFSINGISLSADLKYNFVLDMSGNPIKLGQGTFGKVYLGRDLENPLVKYAVKVVIVKHEKSILETFQNEIRILSVLKHKHIVRYYGSTVDEFSKNCGCTKLSIILEYVEGGTLSHFLDQFGSFNENLIRTYLHQILIGVDYLHSNQIMHRDIKGSNILINRYNGEIKIADFGTCTRLVGLHGCIDDAVGTVRYMAPDVIRISNKGYGLPADIWSVGCTIIEMATGKPPYSEEQNMFSLYLRIGNRSFHPTIPDTLSAELNDLIKSCFLPDPQARLTASELLKHPFLNSCKDLSTLRPNIRIRSYHDSLRKNTAFLVRSKSTSNFQIGKEDDNTLLVCTSSSSASHYTRQLSLKRNEMFVFSWIPMYLLDIISNRRNQCIETYFKSYNVNNRNSSSNILDKSFQVIENILQILSNSFIDMEGSYTAWSKSQDDDEKGKNADEQQILAMTLNALGPTIISVLLEKHKQSIAFNLVEPFECIIKQIVQLILLANFNFNQKPIVTKQIKQSPSRANSSITTVSNCDAIQQRHSKQYATNVGSDLHIENCILIEDLIATNRKYSKLLKSYIDLMQRNKRVAEIIKDFQKKKRPK
ncbi:hypothetical protein GJ496_000789 [Pomphorhynchus laevis]|nr:hypothetical protein GJ496_000789 [Pomphorhynchus laevis]